MGSELDGKFVTICTKYDLRGVQVSPSETSPNCLNVSLAHDDLTLVFEDYAKSLHVFDMVEQNKQQKREVDLSIVDSFLGSIEACLN